MWGYTLTNYVVAEDRSILDAKLRNIYQSMLDNLMVGDVESAMHSVNGVMRNKFEQSFIDAGAELTKIIPNLGTIQGGGVIEDIAQYVIMREENGQPVYFTIYFMKGRDGIWRIGEM